MTTLLSGPTWLLAALLVLLVVALCGPEWIYQRMLGLIRALRGGSSQSDTTPPRQDADRPLS
jgi:hypothetical protein